MHPLLATTIHIHQSAAPNPLLLLKPSMAPRFTRRGQLVSGNREQACIPVPGGSFGDDSSPRLLKSCAGDMALQIRRVLWQCKGRLRRVLGTCTPSQLLHLARPLGLLRPCQQHARTEMKLALSAPRRLLWMLDILHDLTHQDSGNCGGIARYTYICLCIYLCAYICIYINIHMASCRIHITNSWPTNLAAKRPAASLSRTRQISTRRRTDPDSPGLHHPGGGRVSCRPR